MYSENTIIALSTPEGIGAIGVIRISGKKSFSLLSKVFKPLKKEKVKENVAQVGWIKEKERLIDKVVVTFFKNPNSYTGEDLVEISCHGSKYIINEIINLFIKHGVMPAGPGEFTLRSFLNGKIDLSQAEAVSDLISSESKISHEVAINQIRGGFSKKINKLKNDLVDFASLLTLELDFSGEDVEFADRKKFTTLLIKLESELKKIQNSYKYGSVFKEGIPVAIMGKPNSGKSSLLNSLMNEEKSIVSEIQGTTRDIIEDYLIIEGTKFRLIDTAGLRKTKDEIEAIGVDKALKAANKSKIVLFLYDSTDNDINGIKEQLSSLKSDSAEIIVFQNKIDLYQGDDSVKTMIKQNFPKLQDPLPLCTFKSESVEFLKKELLNKVNLSVNQSDTIITNIRHYNAVNNALKEIIKVKKDMQENVPSDLISVDLNSAIRHIGEITGDINSDDILKNIFSNFCIGK